MLEQQPGAERTHHVLRAMREIDDVEQAENYGKAQTQHRVERAVDETDEQLSEESLRRYAEDFSHFVAACRNAESSGVDRRSN
jgi:N-glycosylase/DNA lyase